MTAPVSVRKKRPYEGLPQAVRRISICLRFPVALNLALNRVPNKARAIPHNSKCRYSERGAADAKPKAQIILDAAKVSAASGGNSEPKQGQRSQSARGFCPRSTMRVSQPDIIEHFGNADAVPQLPERCLSRKAGIVRCCLSFLRILGILFGGFGAACASYSRGLSVSLGSAGSFYFASGGSDGGTFWIFGGLE